MDVQRIAIVNSKGGVGKTTSVVCLAGALVERGKRVLVLDLDPQATMSDWLGVRPEDDGAALVQTLLSDDSDPRPLVAQLELGFDIIPAGLLLERLDAETLNSTSRFTRLRKALSRFPAEPWDYLLIDTPGSFSVHTVNALAAADFFIVAMEAAFASLRPLQMMLGQVSKEVREDLQPTLRLLGVLACRMPTQGNNPKQIYEYLEEHCGRDLLRTVIRQNVHLAESVGHQKTIFEYLRDANGAKDYRMLAEELEARLAELNFKRPEEAPVVEKGRAAHG